VNPEKTKRKKRLDVFLVERGLAESRQKAQAIILAGEALVNRQKVTKAGALVSADASIELTGTRPRYASRGGQKLEGALEDFGVEPSGRICLDVGSSTGGFTDCLLQHGAARVYAVDVTVSQLAWKLHEDARVIRVERNARALSAEDVPELVELVTMDVSFISVEKVLAPAVALAKPVAEFLILVKPQFELERGEVGKGGIVREPALHEKAIERVRRAAMHAGLEVSGVRPSRLTGAEGNQEFFLHARKKA
jgi:23S rRNA (cytidine1920-2'-O)/16S rRNA (cytidine1409-2'-O)-methyltransferase